MYSIQMIRSQTCRYICCLWSPDSSHKRSARVIRSCSFVIKVSTALLRVLTLQLRCVGRLMALTRAGGKRPASRRPRSCTPAGGGLTSLPVGMSPRVGFAPSHPQPSLSACDLLRWLRPHHSRSYEKGNVLRVARSPA